MPSQQNRSYCDGLTRRDMLKVGVAAGIGSAISLPEMLMQQAYGAEAAAKKDVSLIILFLQGGLSTIDTLDLKPNAPAEFRGDFSPINTNINGIQVCEHLPQLAKIADKYSLLRNFTHPNSGHGAADHYMLTGYHPTAGFNSGLKPNNQRPCHGSIIAKSLGPKGSIPPYVALPKMHNSGGASYLGSTAAPFVVNADPNAPNFKVPDLVPPLIVNGNRLEDRRKLITTVDRFQSSGAIAANQKANTFNQFQQKAFELMTSATTKRAFDIHQEPDEVRDQYGRHSLGQSCLMARRLIEAGVRCVTIDHTNWDTHYNNFSVLKKDLLPHLDSGLPTLLSDLSQRGLLDNTLVAVFGEFGRTPRVNQYAGRDHWGPSNTILLSGAGIQGGRAIGATNPRGERPASDPVGPEDLAATMYHCIGINPEDEFHTPEGRPIKIVNNGSVIRELL